MSGTPHDFAGRSNRPLPEVLDAAGFPHQPRRGSTTLPGTIQNVEYLLDAYDVTARYNVIKKKRSLECGEWIDNGDNADDRHMMNVVSLAVLNNLPRGDVERYVDAIADQNPYNPVAEWITSRPWDGVDRLPDICSTITVALDFSNELRDILITKWLLSAVAAAVSPRFRSRGVLTLQGKQGIGKTTWVSELVPDTKLRDAVVKLDHQLDAHSKDSIMGAITNWLVEIGELDGSLKKDVARIKGVLTRDTDKVRKVYARTDSEMARRTVFLATVNQANFLVDDTGNSRWWVLPVTAIRMGHGVDMQQVFAQLLERLEGGAEWWLTKDEEALLDESNRAYETISAIEDRLLNALDLDRLGSAGLAARTPTEVLIQIGVANPTNPQCRECGSALRRHIGDPQRIKGRETWRVPFRSDLDTNDKPNPTLKSKFD